MKVIEGSITAPLGFKAAGIHCGIKKKRKDLAIIYSEVPADAAAVFTSNKVKAAPILVSKDIISKGSKIQAVVINSGSANACTGKKGIEDAKETIILASKILEVPSSSVLVASTGKIGMMLPMDKVKKGIKKAVSIMDEYSGTDAAAAILTTDLIKKEIAVEVEIGETTVKIGGITKGSGMIYPNMATMLCFITTDALIDRAALESALKTAVNQSFNLITVDGDRSTNDMVVVLANGLADNKKLYKNTSEYKVFRQALVYVCLTLAKMMVRDGEGATKFIEVKISGAASYADAKTAAFSIANSNLVKTAMYGADPNWGRIVSAVGNSQIKLDPEKINVFFNGIHVVRNNAPVPGGREKAKGLLKGKDITIPIELGIGKGECTIWTSDLSSEYVKINAAYT